MDDADELQELHDGILGCMHICRPEMDTAFRREFGDGVS